MSKENRFFLYCLECYKAEKHMSGREVLSLFNRTGVREYIVACFDALHTTGQKFLMEDIDSFIRERTV